MIRSFASVGCHKYTQGSSRVLVLRGENNGVKRNRVLGGVGGRI